MKKAVFFTVTVMGESSSISERNMLKNCFEKCLGGPVEQAPFSYRKLRLIYRPGQGERCFHTAKVLWISVCFDKKVSLRG